MASQPVITLWHPGGCVCTITNPDAETIKTVVSELDQHGNLLAEADYWHDIAHTHRRGSVVDGDLLCDVIIAACPASLPYHRARAIAETALAELVTQPGITVVRGTHSEPWTPTADTA